MKVHPTAIVDPAAVLADDVEIGPYSIVGAGVRLGSGCRVGPRVTLWGRVTAGCGNAFHAHAVIGGAPEDSRAALPEGRIEIGDENVFREAVSVHGSPSAEGVTRIGSRSRFHYCSVVGHDSCIGHGVLLGTFAVLGAGTVVEDEAWIEAGAVVPHSLRVGRGSWLRAQATAEEDIPSFMCADGNPAEVRGVHPRRRTEALLRAFETIWKSGLARSEALARLAEESAPEVAELVAFLGKTPVRQPEDETH